MALSSIENIFLQARETSQEDIDRICSGILENLYDPEKSGECMNQLRKLYLIIHASSTQPCLTKNLVGTMVNMVEAMDPGKTKECLLCQKILTGILPGDEKDLGMETGIKNNATEAANCALIYLIQGDKEKCWTCLLPKIEKWLSSQNIEFDVQSKLLSFLIAISLEHQSMLQKGQIESVNAYVCDVLVKASLKQAPNPYTINPFKKEQTMVTEVDGTPSRNIFTVLNIGQYYTEDQMMNIFCFSTLYKWIYNCSKEEGRETAKTIFHNLVGKTIDYCFRILDQCERKPKIPSDVELQNSCLLETINLLDLVCKIDEGQVARVYQEIRRQHNRLLQDFSKTRLIIPVLQFFLNHSRTVAHDPHDVFRQYFHKSLSWGFTDTAIAFDTVIFILDNLETLCDDNTILSNHFPNIFKILAWNPRSFVSEFCEILPALMSPTSSIEIFHILLDLPCITICLDVIEKCNTEDVATVPETEPNSSMEAYQHPFYRPMFLFFTRSEGGQGDTINRLAAFHKILEDYCLHPRVVVCSQVVPALLRIWFEVILEEASTDFVSHLLPVLIERCGLLYNILEFKADVKRLISQYFVKLLKKHPTILLDQQSDILDFLMTPANITNREDFFANMVWGVGEYCSTTNDERCTTENIRRFFEVLEALTYELSGMIASTTTSSVSHAKITCMLMSTLAKLSTRCQDLIPRAILCCTKVARQQEQGYLDTNSQETIINRAQELTNILKVPNFAATALNPSSDIFTGRWHQDSSSLPTILRGVYQIISTE
ncbi:AP-5 complex subunit zeta-1-like isoform X2 [Mytilus edulis]|uniref:AP-5 complex subunit zeta-1-like isoform X2 n=1 Tax=Mytilus edulis TaxID=6550 RepID=UPI0039EE115C